MIKLLHISDVHLEAKFFNKSPASRTIMVQSIYDSLGKVIDLAIAEGFNGLIIAGDLFDGQRYSFKSERFLLEQFRRLEEADIDVFYCTGNHDPIGRDGLTVEMKKMKNAYVFDSERIETVVIDRGAVKYRVVSCGHDEASANLNKVKAFPAKTDDVITIGIAHTMVQSVREQVDNGDYMPCSLEDLESKNYDYWALGHIHKTMSVGSTGKIYYSGALQGINYKEVGAKGGIAVAIDDGGTATQFLEFSEILWDLLILDDLEEINSYEGLLNHIRQSVDMKLMWQMHSSDKLVLRIVLSGNTPLYGRLLDKENKRQLNRDLEGQDDLLDLNIKVGDIHPVIDREKIMSDDHILKFILDNLKEPVFLEQVKEAMKKDRFIGAHEDRERYMDQLLEGIEEPLISYMVRKDYED